MTLLLKVLFSVLVVRRTLKQILFAGEITKCVSRLQKIIIVELIL